MANRRPQQNNGRRVDFGRNDRGKNFGRSGVSPWQGGGPGGGIPNLLPLGSGSTEATLALASNIINLLQPRQNPVPSLLDMPIRRDFIPNMGRFDRGFAPNRMGNQNFRRTGNYNRSGERVNHNRKPFRPNEGQRQQNKSSPKKEADSKAKPVKESEPEKETKEVKEEPEKEKDSKEAKKDSKEAPKTRYDDINPQLLKCHICNKSMWDGRSFENHLTGRAHAIMMQKTAESYALTADTMRQEFKIREMKRHRKTGAQMARDFYCAMCDMYAGDGAAHRTTVGHRKLKKYLHPACTTCHKEMPTRIELDEHRLTAEHLRNMQDKQEVVSKPKPEVMLISTLNMEQSYVRDDRQPRRRRDTADKDKQEVEVKKEPTEGDDKPDDKPDDNKKPLDSDDTVLDYKEGDDLTGVTPQQYPAYSSERGVGKSFLSPFQCVQCTLCRKLLDTDETAEVHLKTWRHHQLFLRMLNEKTGHQGKSDGSNSDNKRPSNSDDSGTSKRRKTTTGDGDNTEENGHEEDVVMKEEPVSTSGDLDEPSADGSMPPPDELEDWDNTIDDILNDEADNDNQTNNDDGGDAAQDQEVEEHDQNMENDGEGDVAGADAEPVAEPEPEVQTPVKTPEKAQVDNKPKPTPRGRGRGGRRRY